MADTRLQRLCDVCGQLDDHPRHVQAVDPNSSPDAVPTTAFLQSLPDNTPPVAVAELMANDTYVRHIDCCASTGCPICQGTLDNGAQDLKGPELLAHLQSQGA